MGTSEKHNLATFLCCCDRSHMVILKVGQSIEHQVQLFPVCIEEDTDDVVFGKMNG